MGNREQSCLAEVGGSMLPEMGASIGRRFVLGVCVVAIGLFAVWTSFASGPRGGSAPPVTKPPAWITASSQLILVSSPSWASPKGNMRRFERVGKEGTWRMVGKAVPAALGSRGLAWGRGLHGVEGSRAQAKAEGDMRSPAGAFRVGPVLGTATPARARSVHMPYRQIRSGTECVDDVGSAHYNRVVDPGGTQSRDWNSSESMAEMGSVYRWALFVQHNTPGPVAGAGSCIFVHVWSMELGGTPGCTGIVEKEMKALAEWLDPGKKPILVQLPENELQRLRARWGLPGLGSEP